MRKFIDKITPTFILAYNERLLKNAPLGWQLQLPTITWVWLLGTVLTVPIPFLINLDINGNNDIWAVVLISVLTAVLEGFLFIYLLIQFNNTKTFGRRIFLNGFKEQLAYLYVFMLCMLHIIFYPLIVDIRKGKLMTKEEIRIEAVTYNQAVFYFMGDDNAYRYFPSDASFLHYKYLDEYARYNNSNNVSDKETYYVERVKPLMRDYFSDDSYIIDSKYTRDLKGCPKFYMIENNYIDERPYYYDQSYYDESRDTLYQEKYQVKIKSDAQRLKEISAFIKLYNKYDDGYSQIRFEHPEIILQKYNSNRFSPAFYQTDAISTDYPVRTVDGEVEVSANHDQLSPYRINDVHDTISRAQYNKWSDLLLRLAISFHVALCLAVLLFIFKNIRLKEFILTFVYTGLLVLVISILTVVTVQDEVLAIHVMWIVFLLGIYFSFFEQNVEYYSSLKTVFILLSNAVFAYAPIFMFFYFHEYLDLWTLPNDYNCTNTPTLCEEYYAMENLVLQCALWGGPALYVFLGSILYKRTYERLLALPFAK